MNNLSPESETPEPSTLAMGELLMMYAEAFMEAVPLDVAVGFVRALAEMSKEGEHEAVVLLGKAHPKLRARREAIAELRRALPHLVSKLTTDT